MSKTSESVAVTTSSNPLMLRPLLGLTKICQVDVGGTYCQF